MGEQKTNAMRLLEKAGISYHTHTYDIKDGEIDGMSVAKKLGQSTAEVYKTLVTQGSSGGYFVFAIPVAEELDLKKGAKIAGEKWMAMIKSTDLLKVSGYIRGGCSPIGMKKSYPTFFHHDLLTNNQVMVSGGKLGIQLALAPQDLLSLTGGKAVDLIQG